VTVWFQDRNLILQAFLFGVTTASFIGEKSAAGAAIPVLAFSGRAERVLRPGLEETGWNPPIRGVQVHTEDESKKPKRIFRLN
jgi:hypothetical protein